MTQTGKIALEEHVAVQQTLDDSRPFVPEHLWPELRHRLLDVHGTRLAQMDACGIELMLLSLNSPAVQAVPDRAAARELAERANDELATQVARNPARFQGLAALPMQDPEAACRELERAVRELGFRGVLVNGFSQVDEPDNCVYLDDLRYRPFWALVEALDVPFYLHPRNPIASWAQIYHGAEWLLGPTWAFGQETAVHALRLMGSGLFDAHPRLKIVLGHMGEGIPFSLWRIDHHNAWMEAAPRYPALHPMAHYVRQNIWLTVSGNFSTPALVNALSVVGADRILFSTDWPFENVDHAATWFDALDLDASTRYRIARGNAAALFRLGT
ncbi:MAG: amidohydrolase [Acidobacteria bacterium]|nr:amidohydrolase [Acidobacteriota bacterium]